MVASIGERVGKQKKKLSKSQATHAGYVERDLAAPQRCARISSGRPYEVLLFENRDRALGLTTIITALIDRRSGRLAFAAEARDLGLEEADELRHIARHGLLHPEDLSDDAHAAPPLALVPTEVARLRLSRAILASRIAGQAIPAWLSQRADLVGDPTDPASRIDDVYLCIACDQPLPIAEQLARAEHPRQPQSPPRCPACRGESQAPTSEGDVWLGRGWLMVAAGLPRRALVCAARAESQLVRPDRLDTLRGAALLALGDERAALHLTRARDAGSPDLRVDGWLSSLAERAA